jgi:outer membrane assembly lipoprotein YfiO
MEKTAALFEKVIKNGPYSEYAPRAQIRIGEAQEKRSDYPLAVKAYEKAADRYHDQPAVAAEALFRAGMAYGQQARKADYDQGIAGQAIATLTDFVTLYPTDERGRQAQKTIASLKGEQARGSNRIAQMYEQNRRWGAALIYYNDVVSKDPESELATAARERIDLIKQHIAQGPAPKPK